MKIQKLQPIKEIDKQISISHKTIKKDREHLDKANEFLGKYQDSDDLQKVIENTDNFFLIL